MRRSTLLPKIAFLAGSVLLAPAATTLPAAADQPDPGAGPAAPRAAGAKAPAALTLAEAPEPDVWEPPKRINRNPVGGVPEGERTERYTEPDGGGISAQALGDTPADDAVPKPGLGVQGFYGFEEFPLSDTMTLAVNLGNGNLVVRDRDIAVNGPGIGLGLERFYNGLSSRIASYGTRWSVTAGQDVGLEVAGPNVVFRGPSGFRATFVPAGGGAYTSPPGIDADLVRNGDGTYTLTYQRTGETLSFTPGGFLTRDADRSGNALSYAYNANNDVASITDAAGRVTTFTWASGRVSQITDPAARTVTFAYTNGLLTQVTNRAGKLTKYGYDGSGRLTQITTPGNSVTLVGYDTAGRVTSVKRMLTRGATTGAGALTQIGYASGQTTLTDPNSKTATYAIDSAGRVSSTTDPLGRTRSQTWTSNSSIATATDAMGSGTSPGGVTEFSYDGLNNPTAVQIPTGAREEATYGTGGTCGSTDTRHPHLPKCLTDPAGNKTSYTYDAAGNVLSATTAGVTLSFTYQGTGGASCGGKPGQLCSVTNGRGATTSYSYDTAGNLTKVTPPAPLGATSYSYDSVGRVTSITDGKGKTHTYQYDAMDRLTRDDDATPGNVTIYTYDTDGNLTQSFDTKAGAGTIDYTYDALNRQLTSRASAQANITMSVTLDPAGNTLTATDDGGTTTFSYDAANQLVALAEPGGSCPATGEGTRCTRFDHDNNGNRIKTTFPGSTTQTTTRDASGRPTRILAKNAAGTVLSDLAYSYTVPGQTGPGADRTQVQTRTDALGVGAPAGSTTTYGYDPHSRLTSAVEKIVGGATNASWTYTYDDASNRTGQTRSGNTGGAAGTTSYGYNLADQVTSLNGSSTGWSYDSNGDETAATGGAALGVPQRTATYSTRAAVDTITTIGTAPGGGDTVNRFEYHAAGNTQRMATSVAGAYTRFRSSLLGLTGTRDDATGASTYYTRTPGGELVARRAGASSAYYLTDNLGSVVGLVDATGTKTAAYAYDPYGISRTATGTAAADNPFRYTGGFHDASTGLYKLGARYYDPTLGRFTQRDPTGQDPHYTYAGNAPSSYIDPHGEAFFVPLLVTGARLAAPSVIRASSKYLPRAASWVGSRASGAIRGRAETTARARADAAIGGRCRFRDVCSAGDHVHVDYINKSREIFHTRHYYFQGP